MKNIIKKLQFGYSLHVALFGLSVGLATQSLCVTIDDYVPTYEVSDLERASVPTAEEVRAFALDVKEQDPLADVDKIIAAYDLAEEAHEGQTRSSGVPYVSHPYKVAQIAAEENCDGVVVIASFLHDTVEDTDVTLEEIKEQFGDSVSLIVGSVTKAPKEPFAHLEKHDAELARKAQTMRNIAAGAIEDVRTLHVKLADRTHNMSTLGFCDPAKQVRIAQDTIDYYVSLAKRAGVKSFQKKLENLCFQIQDKENYEKTFELITDLIGTQKKSVDNMISDVNACLNDAGIKYSIEAHVKSPASAFIKQIFDNSKPGQLLDYTTLNMTVGTEQDCYELLEAMDQSGLVDTESTQDNIKTPKTNGHQALRAVMNYKGQKVIVKIRSHDMQKVSEIGMTDESNIHSQSQGMQDLRALLAQENSPQAFLGSLKG